MTCHRCGKTLLGCRLNRRLNPRYWARIHHAQTTHNHPEAA